MARKKAKNPRPKRRHDRRDRKSRSRPVGQPSKLNAHVQDVMVQAIELGVPLEKACHLVGIGYSTHREWVIRGENATDDAVKQEREVLEELQPYAEYAEAIKGADARFIRRELAIIETAAQGTSAKYDEKGKLLQPARAAQWTAAAWKLERRHPKLFALLNRHEHSGPDGGPIHTKSTMERADELTEEYLDRIEERAGKNGAKRRRLSGNGH